MGDVFDFLWKRSTIQPPTTYYSGMDIEAHLGKVEKYVNELRNGDPDSKLSCLLDSLSEDVRAELFALREYL